MLVVLPPFVITLQMIALLLFFTFATTIGGVFVYVYFHDLLEFVFRKMNVPTVRINNRVHRVSTIRFVKRFDVDRSDVYYYGDIYEERVRHEVYQDGDNFEKMLRGHGISVTGMDDRTFRKRQVQDLLQEIHAAAHVPKIVRGVYLRNIGSMDRGAILAKVEKLTDEEAADFTCECTKI